MPELSSKARQAIKIALAMTIAYYIGLQLEWVSSTWLATSVAFVSLATTGQSLDKSALRMGGTLLAMVVGLFYLGLFPQDRWLFFAAFTPWLAFVSYKMTGRDGQYFWFVAAFVSMMITTAGPGSSEHAFNFAVARGLETILGIGLWALVSVFLWPTSSVGALQTTAAELLEKQSALSRALRAQRTPGATDAEPASLRSATAKLLATLHSSIGPAAAESYRVREVRDVWARLQATCRLALERQDRLYSTSGDFGRAELQAIVPAIEGLLDEVEANLDEAARVLRGAAPGAPLQPDALDLDARSVASLDHFHRAAAEVAYEDLQRLAAASREARACALALAGHTQDPVRATSAAPAAGASGPPGLTPLDPDRVRAALTVVASMWISALLWIYVDPPGHVSWYQFVPNLVMAAAQMPQVRLKLLQPLAYAYLVGLAVYVLVMPSLSAFWEIGGVIFVFTFAAAYFFSGLGRVALYLSLFNMLALQNQQTYDFAKQANTLLFTLMAVALVCAFTYLMRSPRPEKAFAGMLRRFFRSAEYLVAWAADPAREQGFLARARRAYHLQELRGLPAKLAAWGGQIDTGSYPRNPPQQTQALIACVQLLAYRVEDLIEARRAPQADALVRELYDDVRAWRLAIEHGFGRWSGSPEADPAGELQQRLEARMAHLGQRVAAALNDSRTVSEEHGANLYRLLGSLRGLSEAAVDYARAAGAIDWAHWREERFS